MPKLYLVPNTINEGSKNLLPDYIAHEIKDDTLLLKWVIRINRTPVNQRLTPTGAATQWDVYGEEHLMATIKGMPTTGIDFTKQDEPRK